DGKAQNDKSRHESVKSTHHTCARRPAHQPDFYSKRTTTTEIYTLSLHDALPILQTRLRSSRETEREVLTSPAARKILEQQGVERSEEHTSELQSPCNLVCRLLLEKKNEVVNQNYQSALRRAAAQPDLAAARDTRH